MNPTSLRMVCDQISRNLEHAFLGTDHPRPLYRGKVRDVFAQKNELIIVATDRVSVFDQVVGTIPLKGALLTEQSTFWLKKAESVVPTHLLSQEDAQIQRCKKAIPFQFEIIVRAYLTGSLLREPEATRGRDYNLRIDPSFKAFDQFDKPIITPTTKAIHGRHDEAISLDGIVSTGLASKSQIDFIVEAAFNLFALGSAFASTRDLILVDSKYEFGLWNDEIILIDEVHTADSSRYWISSTYNQRLARAFEPEMLDKERLRRVLIAQGVDPKGSTPIPPLSDDTRRDLAVHYWQLTETLTGKAFVPQTEPASTRITNWLLKEL